MRVQMLVTISGGRGDNSNWPDAGGTLDVSDTEGAELCKAGMARPVAWQPPPETAVTPAEAVETRNDPPAGAEDDAADASGRPAMNAPKEAWVAHAVTQGADPDAAAGMTKAELISQHGPN